MDFVRLGPAYSTAYFPDTTIEGYSSLVWTERFQSPGEFEMKTNDITRIANLLPEDTLVSHLETQHVMIVETHTIDMVGEGADAYPQLTIKGRSAEVILESRWIESVYQKKRPMRKKYGAQGAAGVLLWQAVANSSGKDVTRGDTDPETEDIYNDYPWNTLDVIPNAVVTDTVNFNGDLKNWQLEQGILYPQFQKILVDSDLGLRVLRPVPTGNDANVVTVSSTLATRGDITRTMTNGITKLRFDLYNGRDRVDLDPKVQLSTLQGHLDKPQYLRSYLPYKTVMQIQSAVTGDWLTQYRKGDIGTAEKLYTGFRRKTFGFDAGSPELPAEPDKPADLKSNATHAQKQNHREAMDKWLDKEAKWKNKRDRIWADFRESEADDVERALKEARKIKMVMGDVSTLAPYQYGKDYFLGDTISLFGDYGYKSSMIVAEYVRTEDENGDRGIPGLVEPLIA